MAKVDITLPESMREWVEARVEAGFYADVSDYVRDLIRHDAMKSDSDLVRLHELNDMINEGLADEEAGRVYEMDEVFDEVYAIIDAAEAKKAAE